MAASGSRLSEVLSTKGPLSSCSSGFECKGLSLTIGPTLYSFPYSPPVPRPCHFLNRLAAHRCLLVDDHSRLIPYAAYGLAADTQALLGCLKEALRRRGLPRKLYTDNG